MLPKMKPTLTQRAGSCLAVILLTCNGAAFAADIPDQIGALREQAIAAGESGNDEAVYLSAKAQALLDFGFEEYTEKDSPELVQFVLQQVPLLIEAARSGKQPPDIAPPVGARIRPDLWKILAEDKASPQFSCTASWLGRLEVALDWAAHEMHELGLRHAQRYLDDAESYARDAGQQAKSCPHRGASNTDEIRHRLIQLPGQVHFAFDSFELSAASMEILRQLSEIMRAYPSLKLQLVGHTDVNGGEHYNEILSQRRADQVRNWLVASGLSADRFATAAMGKRYPLMPGRGTSNGAHNRRVEFVVLELKVVAPGLEVTSKPVASDLQPYVPAGGKP